MTTLTRTTLTRRLIDYPPHRPLSLGQIWDRLSAAVKNMGQPPSEPLTEPNISQHCDRYGNVYWHLYDAKTGRTIYCMSQAEVSLWLDRSCFRA